jgi:hypothetical protein
VAIGYILLVGNPFAAKDTVAPTPSGSESADGGCNIEDISLTPKMTRLGKTGTSLSTAANNYFVITDSLGSYAGNAAATVPTNYDMKIMFGENSTAYYTVVKDFNTDCQDPKYVSVDLPMADTSLNTFYLKNSDGTVNSVSAKQAIGADDTFESTVYMKAGTDTYFGSPASTCENVAVVEYDKTYILKAAGDSPAPVPGAFTYHNSTYDGSNGMIIPKSADGVEVSFNLQLESTSSDPTGADYPQITVYDCDIDKNEDTLAIIEGVEDEDLNSISLAKQTLFIYYS